MSVMQEKLGISSIKPKFVSFRGINVTYIKDQLLITEKGMIVFYNFAFLHSRVSSDWFFFLFTDTHEIIVSAILVKRSY